jgi:hypothetical protein
MKKKQSKTSAARAKGKPKKAFIITLPTNKKAASKTPAKSYPKLQQRFASYDPDVFQTQEDVDRLVKGIEKVKARIAKEKLSQN